MRMRRAKAISLLISVSASTLMLLAWSQTWFTFVTVFSTEESPVLEVSGQVVAPGLSALALAGFAITAALSLAGLIVRRILGLLLVAIGLTATVISLISASAPVSASATALTAMSGISNNSELGTIVTSQTVTFWPIMGFVSGVLAFSSGLLVLLTAASWAQAGRKFETSTVRKDQDATTSRDYPASADATGKNVDTWDSLSRGTDPTTN